MDSAIDTLKPFAEQYLLPFGFHLLAALALWLIGVRVIRLLVAGANRLMHVRELDPTLTRYAKSFLRNALYVLLAVVALGTLGVATTSFAALLAAVGVAIGMAWSGLLSNFAAGVFLVTLRPFRVGEQITAGGVTGTVREIGLFACVLDTADNLRVQIGNNRLLSENIINYSSNKTRRCEVRLQLALCVSVDPVLENLLELARGLSLALEQPPPQALVVEINATGPMVALRFHCNAGDYNAVQAEAFRQMALRAEQKGWLVAPSVPAANESQRNRRVEAGPFARYGS